MGGMAPYNEKNLTARRPSIPKTDEFPVAPVAGAQHVASLSKSFNSLRLKPLHHQFLEKRSQIPSVLDPIFFRSRLTSGSTVRKSHERFAP